MIPTSEQVIAALIGAWRLFRFDPSGHAVLDRSIDGFWRSFFCAALVAPFYAVLVGLRMDPAELANPLPRVVLVEAIAYVIAWVAFPLAMLYLSQWLDRAQHYVGYIVAYNWCAAPQVLLMLLVAIVRETAMFPDLFLTGLQLGATFYGWAVLWFVAHSALAITRGTAALVVVIDLLISLLIAVIAQSMLKSV